MKKLLLIIFTVILFSANGQIANYHPMLDSINNWSYENNGLTVSPQRTLANCTYPVIGYPNMVTTTDTIINAKTYKQLYGSDGLVYQCLLGFLREDTSAQKIYFLDNNGNPEILLYDFSMHPGDSINIKRNYYANPVFYTLDSIYSTTIWSGTRKEFYLTCHSCSAADTIRWLESVGNLENLIYPFNDYNQFGSINFWGCAFYPDQLSYFMICYEHNQKIYFDSCAYHMALNNICFAVTDSCNFQNTCGSIDELSSRLFSFHPNPFNSTSTLEIKNINLANSQLKIFDSMGRIMQQQIIRDDLTIINRNEMPAGIYFFQLISRDGKTGGGKFIIE